LSTRGRHGRPLGPYLADLARLHAAQQDGEQVKALLAEALALGGRNVALAAVEVYTAVGEPPEAKRYVDAAYHELQRICDALETLGMPEPQPPPFDPARIPPLPDEAEIRAFIEEREQDEDEENDEDSARDDLVALTPEIEPANPTETVTSTQSNGKRPRWKFWSQN
jgi:hypothetical protein